MLVKHYLIITTEKNLNTKHINIKMQFIKYLFLFVNLFSVKSFTVSQKIKQGTSLKMFETYDIEIPTNKMLVVKKKANGFFRIIRPVNIVPTLVLCSTGGYIMNPGVNLFKSQNFIVSNVIVLLIMFNSMIINDMFDIHTDKINNPDRPLVTGEISIKDSLFLSLSMFIISEFLNTKFIPSVLQYIPRLANIIILAYTPILKRIPFIKNLSCALLVSSTLLFNGFASINSGFLNKNLAILALATQLVFTGSFYNEMLLDIADLSGDKENKIYTIPVLFGEIESLKMIANITILNVLWCVYNLSCMFGSIHGAVLFYLCFPLFKNIVHIRDTEFSKDSIKYSVKSTIKPMIIALFYLSILSMYY